MQPVVGQLDEDEEDSDGAAVDAQSHGGGRKSLWRTGALLALNHESCLNHKREDKRKLQRHIISQNDAVI